MLNTNARIIAWHRPTATRGDGSVVLSALSGVSATAPVLAGLESPSSQRVAALTAIGVESRWVARVIARRTGTLNIRPEVGDVLSVQRLGQRKNWETAVLLRIVRVSEPATAARVLAVWVLDLADADGSALAQEVA